MADSAGETQCRLLSGTSFAQFAAAPVAPKITPALRNFPALAEVAGIAVVSCELPRCNLDTNLLRFREPTRPLRVQAGHAVSRRKSTVSNTISGLRSEAVNTLACGCAEIVASMGWPQARIRLRTKPARERN
jgi:hypothetical protein